jgi:hypothetical protein
LHTFDGVVKKVCLLMGLFRLMRRVSLVLGQVE